ncbi:MAG: hypothetical protein ACJA1C_001993 [Crocinitomicaceae bacterium]|jgi:hypothetical protein
MISGYNFWEDFDLVIKDMLNRYEIRYSKSKKTTDLLLDFLTISKKIVTPVPRSVILSPILESKIQGHPKQIEIENLITLFKAGGNVNFFQSDSLLQSRKHDDLMYEWNIHHFHLSIERDTKSKFFKRTKALLFVYIMDNKAIFLDVENHSRKGKYIFADPYWVQILHDHFPKEIEKYQHTFDMPQSDEDYTPKERMELWEKGYTTLMYKIGGVTYGSPGIGRTTSGHSTLVIKQHGEIIRWVHYVQNIFNSNEDEINKTFNFFEPNFQLAMTEFGFSIVEHRTKQIVISYPNIFTNIK